MDVIDKSLLTERVYQHLLERIINKTLTSGARLAEEVISAELEVSRTPVREALQRLAREGLVEYAPRRGCRVKALSRKDVEDIFELRCVLEPLALRAAIKNLRPADINRLEALLDDTRIADPQQQRQAAIAVDDKMHELLCRRCANKFLGEYLLQLIRLSRPYRSFGADTTADRRKLYRQRREIMAALRAGKTAIAEKLLIKHIREGKEAILTKLSAAGG